MDIRETTSKLLQGDVKGVIDDVVDELERTIGLVGVVIISLASMLGPTLFVLPAFAIDITVNDIWFAYILAACVVLPAALSKSELSTAMPSSGGTYVYIERTFGPVLGTITGLGAYASFTLKSAFSLIGFAAYLDIITRYYNFEVNIMSVSLSILGAIVLINIMGVKKVKLIQAPIVGLTLITIIGLCIWSFFSTDVVVNRPLDAIQYNLDLATTTAFVFVSYTGVTKVAAIAGEVQNPGRNIPAGMLISLGIATLLYAGMTFMFVATMPENWHLDTNGNPIENPVYVFAEYVAGSTVGLLVAFLAILTMASMALAGILASSRFLFAMARDNLLPQALEDCNSKYETPHWSIIITGLLMAITLIYLPIDDLAKLASGFKIMIFILVNLTVIVLRHAGPRHLWYQPTYHSPLYPLVQIFGILAGIGLVFMMGEKTLLGALAATVLGLFTYFSYGRKHVHPRLTPFHSFRAKFKHPTPEEHERRYAAFHAADVARKNHLTLKEFQAGMAALGICDDPEECRVIFHEIDDDENGIIDIDEFLAMFENPSAELE